MKAAGKPVTFIVGEGYNHFEIQETLASPVRAARPRSARADEACLISPSSFRNPRRAGKFTQPAYTWQRYEAVRNP